MVDLPHIVPEFLKVLAVDDHAGVRRTIREFLPAGEVTECADGEEALSRCASEHPDRVLIDGMDGLTATRRLKARFPRARVTIAINHDEAAFRSAAGDHEVCAFVHKKSLEQLQRITTHYEDTHS